MWWASSIALLSAMDSWYLNACENMLSGTQRGWLYISPFSATIVPSKESWSAVSSINWTISRRPGAFLS